MIVDNINNEVEMSTGLLIRFQDLCCLFTQAQLASAIRLWGRLQCNVPDVEV